MGILGIVQDRVSRDQGQRDRVVRHYLQLVRYIVGRSAPSWQPTWIDIGLVAYS
ncbi:hypothetical protein LFM09_36850 [Lentzea alba]|uniref:hypothetical protein n=1 Tax=Lentzea alba TaxID=2714351 RepID=UPI0039BFD4F5